MQAYINLNQSSPFLKYYATYLQGQILSEKAKNNRFIDSLIDKLETKSTRFANLKFILKFCLLILMMAINTYTIYIGAYTGDRSRRIDWIISHFEFYFVVIWIVIWFIYIDFHFRGQKNIEFLIGNMKFISGFSMFLFIHFLSFDMTIYNFKRLIKKANKWQKLTKIFIMVIIVVFLAPIAIIALFVRCR